VTIEEPDAGPRPVDVPHRREFLGHPVGLPVIAFTEAFERFSYYGMQTLLVLYMVKALLLAPHVEHIVGFGWFSNVLAGIYGAPPNTQALASHIFGTYTMLVYVTPILGGLLADRWLGKTLTVTIGALLMAAGHFLMAFDVSFLLALLLLVLGVGCLKGNLASQVGALYAPGDGRATDAFQIYYIGISFGAFFAPLVCGALGEEVGWHWGFGAAGVGMVIGLVIYLMGRRHLPPDPLAERRTASASAAPRAAMTRRDVVVLVLLLFMVPVLAVSAIGNQQMFNAYLVWADRSYEFMLFGHRMPTSFLVSFDAFTGLRDIGRRGGVLALVCAALARTRRDEQIDHRLPDLVLRLPAGDDRRQPSRGDRRQTGSMGRARGQHAQQSGVRQRLSGQPRALFARRAAGDLGDRRRHLLSVPGAGQLSGRRGRRLARDHAGRTLLGNPCRRDPGRGGGVRGDQIGVREAVVAGAG